MAARTRAASAWPLRLTTKSTVAQAARSTSSSSISGRSSLKVHNGFKIAVTSLQQGESFQLFGSNFEGTLGTAISGPYPGLTFDDEFVAVTDLGSFTFLSIAGFGDGSNVLPSRFSAEITPIPEIGTVMPIVGLLVAIGATHVLRRRRAATLAA